MNDEVTALVAEFKKVGLTDRDARRSAFCALAYHRGWNAARIGRYLGVSRARVGQRVERLRQLADTRTDMPALASLLESAATVDVSNVPDLPVAFPPGNWDDRDFALGLLQQLAPTPAST